MKKKASIILISIITFIILIIILGYVFYKSILNDLTDNIKLEPDKYLTAVEIESKSNFMLFINKDKNISNIIFLNGYSINSLYKQKIEGKSIQKGIELIVNKLKSNNEFNDNSNFKLINYGDNNIYKEIKEEFNKQFVIYGINKEIYSDTSNLKEKLINLNHKSYSNQTDNLKQLYNISLDFINMYLNSEEKIIKLKEEDLPKYATNIYNKLVTYSKQVPNQEKNSQTGLDISTINATFDYNYELYPEKDSWYYIENGIVYAYIKFNYNDKIYEYCYKGEENYTEGIC